MTTSAPDSTPHINVDLAGARCTQCDGTVALPCRVFARAAALLAFAAHHAHTQTREWPSVHGMTHGHGRT